MKFVIIPLCVSHIHDLYAQKLWPFYVVLSISNFINWKMNLCLNICGQAEQKQKKKYEKQRRKLQWIQNNKISFKFQMQKEQQTQFCVYVLTRYVIIIFYGVCLNRYIILIALPTTSIWFVFRFLSVSVSIFLLFHFHSGWFRFFSSTSFRNSMHLILSTAHAWYFI